MKKSNKNKHFWLMKAWAISRLIFLAPTGAQGSQLSVCLYFTNSSFFIFLAQIFKHPVRDTKGNIKRRHQDQNHSVRHHTVSLKTFVSLLMAIMWSLHKIKQFMQHIKQSAISRARRTWPQCACVSRGRSASELARLESESQLQSVRVTVRWLCAIERAGDTI